MDKDNHKSLWGSGVDTTIKVYKSSGLEFSFGLLIIVILFGSLWVYMIATGVV